MIRATLLAWVMVSSAVSGAMAQELVREDLRIPMAAAGPRGLEAMLLRPPGTRRFPLALISHGAPRQAADRAGMAPTRLYPHAVEFVHRGFAALVVMRRGYGNSDGAFAEHSGPCDQRDYLRGGRASVADLRAAIEAMGTRTDVTTQGMIAVGVSAGGFASVALAAEPPAGLAAVISFAGGRGSRADNDVCSEAALVNAFATYGKTARVPMLWVYAANDKFFGPDLAHRMHAAFNAAGGRAQFIEAAPFDSDGHYLFSVNGMSIWTPMVDRFLREQNLGSRDLIALPSASLKPPPQLSDKGRASFATYLASGPHKAFAVSAKGAFGYRTGKRTSAEAQGEALAACTKFGADCTMYAIDDQLADKSGASPH